jgi:DNA-directed RNA polymerase subunit RPC12/RpoP
MFQRTRKVACPECNGSNFWHGNPKPTDVLVCRYCSAAVITYAEYVEQAAQREAERLLAEFVETDVSRDLAHLKAVLSAPEQRVSP